VIETGGGVATTPTTDSACPPSGDGEPNTTSTKAPSAGDGIDAKKPSALAPSANSDSRDAETPSAKVRPVNGDGTDAKTQFPKDPWAQMPLKNGFGDAAKTLSASKPSLRPREANERDGSAVETPSERKRSSNGGDSIGYKSAVCVFSTVMRLECCCACVAVRFIFLE